MDDSDQDFVVLCSKLLKRVPRRAAATGGQGNTKPQSSTTTSAGDQNKKKKSRRKRDVDTGSRGALDSTSQPASFPACPELSSQLSSYTADSKQTVINGGVGDHGLSAVEVAGGSSTPEDILKRELGAKETVILRMQQFKRVPPKLMHSERNQPAGTETENDSGPATLIARDPVPSTSSTTLDPEGDEALAIRLQEELDREAQVQARPVDLEVEGLFFCQLCQRDLSAMSPGSRTQHINRCLDESEHSAPAPAPAPTTAPLRVPECPICGKGFKSNKSRSTHMKRCSSDMGVPPAMLLQALHRQAAEAGSDSSVNQPLQTGGSKRKGSTDPSLPVRKRPRKKAQGLDEDTMVALALSRSLLEQEKEKEKERALQREVPDPHTSMRPLLKKGVEAAKGRGRRKRGAPPRPPPLLLVQDAEVALRRLQEHVAALLLRTHSPPPPTPTRCPSRLPAQVGSAPLWQKSALRDGGPRSLSEFYTPELSAFIVPWESVKPDAVSPIKSKPGPSTNPKSPMRDCTPISTVQIPPVLSQPAPSPAPFDPGQQLPVVCQTVNSQTVNSQTVNSQTVNSQTLQDLMELADEGMTLTQWGYSSRGTAKDKESSPAMDHIPLSGFTPEEGPDQHHDLPLSGFIPETHHHPERAASRLQPRAPAPHTRPDKDRSNQNSVALSRLTADLTSMVNNPQLSDVQLQVDTGEVYFTHSFMLYARCPLLAQIVHDSGFRVQEEGMPAAQLVLMGEVPGLAVYALLQYLYTAHCPLTPALLPHVQELASRFGLQELQQLCELHPGQTETQGEGELCKQYPAQELCSGEEEDRGDQDFMELLHSMWNEEDDGRAEEGGMEEGQGGGVTLEDGETKEERVNEEEMEEIYEFAATQRQREEDKESREEEEEEEEEDEEGVNIHMVTKEDEENPLSWFSLTGQPERRHLTSNRSKPECDIEKDSGSPDQRRTDIHKADVLESECMRTAIVEPDSTEEHGRSRPDAVVLEPGESEPKNVTPVSKSHRSPFHNPDPSLGRSYSRLFSDSWGEYDEEEPVCPPPASFSQPSRTRVQGSHRKPEVSRLQSSNSEVIDLSISPPPNVPAFPVPGLSPGVTSDEGRPGRTEEEEGEEEGRVGLLRVCEDLSEEQVSSSQETLKRETHGPHIIAVLHSPPPNNCKQPELIVLSDSSEEMEVDLAPTSPPSPPPPHQTPKSYTRIRTEPDTEPQEPSLKDKKTSSPVCAPGVSSSDQDLDPGASGSGSAGLDQSPMDYSPEVSWLIPTTPLQASKGTNSSSTQTHSSMRRTQLFPKTGSSSSASVFSPPTLPLKPTLQTSATSNPLSFSKHVAQAESSISRQNSDSSGLRSSSLGLDHSPKKYSSSSSGPDRAVDPNKLSPVFTVPSYHPRRPQRPSLTSSFPFLPTQDPSTTRSPLHDLPQPYSSTPLHSDPPHSHGLSWTSPFLSDSRREGEGESSQRGRGVTESPGKRRGLGSLGLSFSDPSSPSRGSPSRGSPSRGSPSRGSPSPQKENRSPGPRRSSTESDYFHSPGDSEREGEKKRGMRNEGGVEEEEEEEERGMGMGREEEQEEGMSIKKKQEEEEEEEEVAGCSFQQSFLAMDEPPMAFDDSWGLNGGGDGDGDGVGQRDQAACFSLRLESSSGSGDNLPRLGHGEIADPSSTPSRQPPNQHTTLTPPQANQELRASVLERFCKDWEDEEAQALPLSQRVKAVAPAQRVAQLKTPVASRRKDQRPLEPITPMPSYSDMDTPDLKNKLNRFGVRPLPKKQMVLKLKEIHQYTHQLVSSESEDEAPSLGRPRPTGPLPSTSMAPRRLVSCAQAGGLKEPRAPPTASPVKVTSEDPEPLSASQGSNTSSTATSEDSYRSNPELPHSIDDGDSDSDGSITASQAASKDQERLQAVRRFILSDSDLHGQILQYQPLVLSQLQTRLKAVGIRLGTAKLMDYLDSQCITFTTAKPGQSAPGRRRGRGGGRGAAAAGRAGARGRGRRRGAAAAAAKVTD